MSGDAKTTPQQQKAINFDDVLKNELGQFGLYQLRNVFLVAIPMMISAFKSDYIFTAGSISHRCQISECGEDGKLHEYNPEWILNAVPESSSGFASCQRYAPIDSRANETLDFCPTYLFNRSMTVPCDGYVYARNNTIVYDFDLGCQEWLRVLPGTLNSLGIFIGLSVTGFISDKYGRRFALIFSALNSGVIGLIRTLSINYVMYVILHLLQTSFGSGIYSSAYILAAELVGPKYRVTISAVLACIYTTGQITLGGVAWLVPQWRLLTLYLYLPCLLLITYFWTLSESVRWLLSKKKFIKAKQILEKVAKVNKKHLSQTSLDALTISPMTSTNAKKEDRGFLKTVMKSPILLRRLCVTPVWWATGSLVLNGLSINSTGLSESIYLNYMLIAAIQIPGNITGALALDIIGRKKTLLLSFFFCSFCNFVFVFIPTNYLTLRVLLYMSAKFCIAIVMMSLYLYSTELYPTEYRHRLLAVSTMLGRIGSTFAPLTPALMTYWHGIPSIMFGTLSMISGLLVFTQPETLGSRLPETVSEAEMLGKSESKSNR